MYAGIVDWMGAWSCDGEAGLISRNDALFRMIDHLAGFTFKMRDLHDSSTVGTTRTDATMGINGCALLLIEEKDLESIRAAEVDLRRKFRWIPHFHKLPFVLGMAITRTELGVYALLRTGDLRPLFHTQLIIDRDRWSCVVVCVNIARVLRYFTENRLFHSLAVAMNETVYRGQGKQLRIGMHYVEVTYADKDTFQKLKNFYLECADKGVPHMELPCPQNGIMETKKRFRLIPVGLERKPEGVEELRTALQHVLECVTALHRLGFCHCDIRWNNVVVADDAWHLIDCTFATALNDVTQLNRVTALIKPRFVFHKDVPWSTRHDFYQIGLLLSDSEFGSAPAFGSLRDYLCDRNVKDTDMSIVMAMLEHESP